MKNELTPQKKIIFDKFSEKERKAHGAGNDTQLEVIPEFNQAKSEKVISGENNTSIVFGKDRPGDLDSGYGGAGVNGSGQIDIVVGRASSFLQEADGEQQLVVNNSIPYDAARATLSQRSDGDTNHYLADGNVGNRKNCSFAIIKADNTRILSREGIKIVTGLDNYNSNGRLNNSKFGVDIIANNNDKDLQPMVKGDNLVEAIEKLTDIVSAQHSELTNLYKIIIRLSNQLALHIHPTGVGPSGPAVNLIAESSSTNIDCAAHLLNIQGQEGVNTDLIINYLKPYGEKYINSHYNKVN